MVKKTQKYILILSFSVLVVPGKAFAASTVNLSNNVIIKDINVLVKFLAAAVGVTVIGVIIWGGIEYSMAGGNAQAVTAAKKKITNALISLVLFIFALAFLQWLVFGGF